MSNIVYEDILLPIIQRQLSQDPTVGSIFSGDGYHRVSIRDQNLEKFVLQEMNKRLGVNGKVTTDPYGNILEDEYCTALRITLEEMQKNNPEELEAMLEEILKLYIKIGLLGAVSKSKIENILKDDGKGVLPNPYFQDPRKKKQRKPKEMVKVV